MGADVGERMEGRGVRVVVLDHTAVLGGAELALVRLLDHLDPQVQTRTVLFADGPLVRRLEEAGQRVEVVPLDPGLASTDRQAAGRSKLSVLSSALRALPFVVRLGL